jgi:hypothetical protein
VPGGEAAAESVASTVSPGDRPIKRIDEDRLNRAHFIEGLVAMLVDPGSGQATGVTAGMTGAAGAGKTSTLNLLEACLRERVQGAIVVRFDAWGYGGNDDITARFAEELAMALALGAEEDDAANDAAQAIAAYGRALVGVDPSGAPQLAALRQPLGDALTALDRPIVILVDDLDRLGAAGIDTMARALRVAFDFPAISCLLTYDPEGLAEELGGGGDESEAGRRARTLLERTVDLQVPLPAVLSAEIVEFLQAGIEAFAGPLALEDDWREKPRFRNLLEALAPGMLDSLRDVHRLMATFRVLQSMVGDEVDWIDLLGFCALMIKAPRTVENIRRNPTMVAREKGGSSSMSFGGDRRSPGQRITEIIPPGERSEPVRKLLSTLFPMLSNTVSDRETSPDSICLIRPLLTLLRLQRLPGSYTRNDILEFLASDLTAMHARLGEVEDDGTFNAFLERFGDVYAGNPGIDHNRVWQALSTWVEAGDGDDDHARARKRGFGQRFTDFFFEQVLRGDGSRDRAAELVATMIDRDEVMLPSLILRRHAVGHGMGGAHPKGGRELFLDERETMQALNRAGQHYRQMLVEGRLLDRLADPSPILNLLETKLWDKDSRATLEDKLGDATWLDRFVLWLCGKGERAPGGDMLDRMLDPGRLVERMVLRYNSDALEEMAPALRTAYEEAIGV